MMNRQLRRAQAKQDRKVEQEKQDRREARTRKVEKLKAQRVARREQVRRQAAARRSGETVEKDKDKEKGTQKAAATPGRKPGRFSGALTIATIFFIVLQATVPVEEAGNPILRSVTGAGFYLLFGYFSMLWSMRRELQRPRLMTLVSGAMLILGVEVAKVVQGLPTDWLQLAIAVPAMVGGVYLGKLVYENTPA